MVNCGDSSSARSYCTYREMDFATKFSMSAAAAFYFWYSIRWTRKTKKEKSQISNRELFCACFDDSSESKDERMNAWKIWQIVFTLFYSILKSTFCDFAHKGHAFKLHEFAQIVKLFRMPSHVNNSNKNRIILICTRPVRYRALSCCTSLAQECLRFRHENNSRNFLRRFSFSFSFFVCGIGIGDSCDDIETWNEASDWNRFIFVDLVLGCWSTCDCWT